MKGLISKIDGLYGVLLVKNDEIVQTETGFLIDGAIWNKESVGDFEIVDNVPDWAIANFAKISNFDSDNDILWCKFNEEFMPQQNELENQQEYVNLVAQFVHEKYSTDDELALQAKAIDTIEKSEALPEEYTIYRDYVQGCKDRARGEIFGE